MLIAVSLLSLLVGCNVQPQQIPDPVENGSTSAASNPAPKSGAVEKEEDKKPTLVVDPNITAQVQVKRQTSFTGYEGVHRVKGTSGDGVKWVVINEVSVLAQKADSFANPFASPWIELYSREAQTFDLVGYRLSTDPSVGFEGALPLPAGSYIELEGYLSVFANNKDQGRPVLPLELTVPGQLLFWDPEGNLVDHIRWERDWMPPNGSLARVPDGGPGFGIAQDSRPMRRTRPFTHEERENFSAFGRRAK